MTRKTSGKEPGRPGRRASLNESHVTVLRAITQEQPRSSLDEVTRELLLRTGTKVSTVTVRKALREAGIERLKPVRSFDHSPLFQVMLALQNAPLGDIALEGLDIAPMALPSVSAKFDLTVSLQEVAGGLDGSEVTKDCVVGGLHLVPLRWELAKEGGDREEDEEPSVIGA